MLQTQATKEALKRDKYLCRWCLEKGIITRTGEGHHIFGRARSDVVGSVISLCRKCHRNHHNGQEPSTPQILSIMPEAEELRPV